MNTSYKIALGAAVLLCVLVVGYSILSEGQPPADGTTGDAATPDDRLALDQPTRPLALDRPADTAPPVPEPTPGPAPSNDAAAPDGSAGDLYARALRARMAAAEGTASPAPDAATPSTVDEPSEPAPAEEPSLAAANTPSDAAIGEGDGPPPAPSTYIVGSSTPPAIPAAEPGPRTTGAAVPAAPVIGEPAPTPPPAASSPLAGAASTVPGTNQYTIKAGDNFARIAIEVYGDESKWVDIAQANPLVDPRKLKVGQVIRLPSTADLRAAAAPPPPAATVSGTTYVVRTGDSLSSIADRFYGDRSLWDVIHRANIQVIGPDPDQIAAGDKLVIPPKP